MRLPIGKHSAWLCLLFSVILCPLPAAYKSQLQLFGSSCKADDEIAAKDREPIGQAALRFIQDALGADSSAAYATFTAGAKESVPLERFVSSFQNGIKPMGPFKDLKVAHTYLAKVTGGSQEQRVVSGNVSSPQAWVAVNVKPGPSEAHVIIEAQTINNTVDFVIWLVTEQGNWHIQYVHYATVGMVGKTVTDLQKAAAEENGKEHNFNAFILYAAALHLSDRGPFFQLGIKPEIEKRIGGIPRPRMLEGQPPFTWNLDKSTFKVLNVGPIGIGGKIYLLVDHEIEPWAQDKEADRKNRDLIAGFMKTYPEYKEVFAGLVVRAHERGGSRGFGTVEENQK